MAPAKILVADDNETVLMALEYSMSQAGYSVIKATDGEQAYNLALTEKPDIIVSDITMPEMDGLELCEKVRSLPRLCDVPFIFLTAHGEPDERVKGLRLGADDYVVKPFDVQELIARIEVICKNIRKRNYSNTLSGNIKELSIPDTLQIFAQSKKKGSLIVRTETGDGTISFCDGNLVDTSFHGLSGEDALVELLRLQTGHFHFEPRDVTSDPQAKPVNHAMLEAIRLIDERENQGPFVPDFTEELDIADEVKCDDSDVIAVVDAFRRGASNGNEAMEASGLSRVRCEVALATLSREGTLRPRLRPEMPVERPEATEAGKSALMDTSGIRHLLESLRAEMPGLKETLLISHDGFPIVSTFALAGDEEQYTSVGAILCESGQRSIRELRMGEMDAVITIGSEGYFVVTTIDAETLLMTVASPEAQLGLLLFKLKRVVPRMLKLMASPCSGVPDGA